MAILKLYGLEGFVLNLGTGNTALNGIAAIILYIHVYIIIN